MTITLRELATGKPVVVGDVVHDRHSQGWYVDSWDTEAYLVYLRKPGKPHDALSAWGPFEVFCYIGEERGQPISEIKWGAKTGRTPAPDTLETVGREVIRAAFMEALGDYIDARIDYRAGDPEWRSYREGREAEERLEKALADVLKHGV